MADICCLFDPN